MNLEAIPKADFHDLETLWFQVSGTLCNLRCTHCFISCSPDNHKLEMMDTASCTKSKGFVNLSEHFVF